MTSDRPAPTAPRLDEIDAPTRRRLIARTAAATTTTVAAFVAAYYIAPWDGGGSANVAVRVTTSMLLLVVVSALAIPRVLRDPYPALRAVQALAVVIGLAVVSFAATYLLLSSNDPAAFTEPLDHTDALYFSMTTSTTIGYGDISAVSSGARIVVMAHMVTNVVVIGIAARILADAARRRTGDR